MTGSPTRNVVHAVLGDYALLHQVCESLDPQDVDHLRQTAKHFAACLAHPQVWAKKFAPSVICWPLAQGKRGGGGVIRTALSPAGLGIPGRHDDWSSRRYSKALGDYDGHAWRVETGLLQRVRYRRSAALSRQVERLIDELQRSHPYSEFSFGHRRRIALERLVDLRHKLVQGRKSSVYPRDALRTAVLHGCGAVLMGCIAGFVTHRESCAVTFAVVVATASWWMLLFLNHYHVRDAVCVLWGARKRYDLLVEDAHLVADTLVQELHA